MTKWDDFKTQERHCEVIATEEAAEETTHTSIEIIFYGIKRRENEKVKSKHEHDTSLDKKGNETINEVTEEWEKDSSHMDMRVRPRQRLSHEKLLTNIDRHSPCLSGEIVSYSVDEEEAVCLASKIILTKCAVFFIKRERKCAKAFTQMMWSESVKEWWPTSGCVVVERLLQTDCQPNSLWNRRLEILANLNLLLVHLESYWMQLTWSCMKEGEREYKDFLSSSPFFSHVLCPSFSFVRFCDLIVESVDRVADVVLPFLTAITSTEQFKVNSTAETRTVCRHSIILQWFNCFPSSGSNVWKKTIFRTRRDKVQRWGFMVSASSRGWGCHIIIISHGRQETRRHYFRSFCSPTKRMPTRPNKSYNFIQKNTFSGRNRKESLFSTLWWWMHRSVEAHQC